MLLSVLSSHFGLIFDIKMRDTNTCYYNKAKVQMEKCVQRIQVDITRKLNQRCHQLLSADTYISGSYILGHILGVDYKTDIDVYFDTSQSIHWVIGQVLKLQRII